MLHLSLCSSALSLPFFIYCTFLIKQVAFYSNVEIYLKIWQPGLTFKWNEWPRTNSGPFPLILSLINSCSGSDAPSLFSQLPLVGMKRGLSLPFLANSFSSSHSGPLSVCMWGKTWGLLPREGCMFPVIKALPVVDGAANWLLTYVSVKICSPCFFSLCYWLSSWELLKSFLNNERKVGHDLIYLAVSLTVVLIDRLLQIWNLLSFL